jgi:hypothetical protein
MSADALTMISDLGYFQNEAFQSRENLGLVRYSAYLFSLKVEGGRIVIACCSTPFSCPGAPYEAAFVVDSMLRSRKNRPNYQIALHTPEARRQWILESSAIPEDFDLPCTKNGVRTTLSDSCDEEAALDQKRVH